MDYPTFLLQELGKQLHCLAFRPESHKNHPDTPTH